MTADSTPTHYGARLRQARNIKGWSLEEVVFRVRLVLGRAITAKKIARLEDGTTSEHGADAALVIALCQLYEIDPWEVSPVIAERAVADALVLAAVSPGPAAQNWKILTRQQRRTAPSKRSAA